MHKKAETTLENNEKMRNFGSGLTILHPNCKISLKRYFTIFLIFTKCFLLLNYKGPNFELKLFYKT